MQPEQVMKAQSYHHQLIAEMEQRLGRALVSDIRDAFLQVPRHLFIEQYYEQQGNSLTWDLITSPSLEKIYHDEALATLIDEQGLPSSSSSQPSVMAQQLEALAIQPGQCILEIGTGTGYNAAVMEQLVGPRGRVVSIDIDEELVNTAHRHLMQAGCIQVLARVGDGFAGEQEHMPYDRLLATCGIRAIPRPWQSQLKQGGILICNVLLPLVSLFVRLEKVHATKLQGGFLPIDARYMEIRKPQSIPMRRGRNWKKYDALPQQDIALPENGKVLINNSAYGLLLQCLLPEISKHYRWMESTNQFSCYLLDRATANAAVRIDDAHLTVYGNAEHVARQIKESIALYRRLGSPTITDYTVNVVDQQTRLSLDDFSIPGSFIAPE